jgi:prepilin-type N-terminal cleavage/methylation domain-containing protein
MTTLARLRRLVSDRRGMTIMEIMIAIAIMAVGLAALSSAIPIAAYGIQEGSQLSTATFLANQRLEQARNATWNSVDKLGISASSTAAPVGDGGVTTFPDESPMAAPYAGYTRTVQVTDCGVGPGCSAIVDASLRQVTVTVSYRPMSGVGVATAATTKSAVVTMYIAKR